MIRLARARLEDCLAIAELGQLAGHNIPGHFWDEWRQPGDSIVEAGARKAASEKTNFSYRNTQLAWIDGQIAGMLLGYRMPSAEDNDEDPQDFEEWIRPMVELELLVPESFYINMIATYARFRGQGVGTALLGLIDELAVAAGCNQSSLQVFDYNTDAIRLYQRHGFDIIAERDMIASDYLPSGKIFLMTRPVTG